MGEPVTPRSESALHSGASDRSASVSSVAQEPVSTAASDAFDYGTDGDPDSAAVARAFADLDRLTRSRPRARLRRARRPRRTSRSASRPKSVSSTRRSPSCSRRCDMEDCTTSSGIQVKVKREIKASLPGHDRVEARMGALRWLVEQGHGGVIKNNVTVSLDRGADDRADALVVELRAKGFDVEAKKDVHASTLGALFRELMADGKIVPTRSFNLFDMRLAKLSGSDRLGDASASPEPTNERTRKERTQCRLKRRRRKTRRLPRTRMNGAPPPAAMVPVDDRAADDAADGGGVVRLRR